MKSIEVKTILTGNHGTGMNVYRGCTHGCIYCDSRSACYHTPVPFEDIEVKKNAVELLDSALRSKRRKCMIGTGSMCDPYMPCEKTLKITRGCLEVIDRHGFGATVLTKSNLVLRDFDLLKKINSKTKAVLQMTLTTGDDGLCRKIEPNVCPTSERFRVLMEAKKESIPTVVWLTPFLPYINDTKENIMELLEMCAKASVRGIVIFGFGLTLRDGNREYFYKSLDEKFPGLKDRYINQFGTRYEVSRPESDSMYPMVRRFCMDNKILYRPDDTFAYLNRFEEKDVQLTLF
ncbi:SPL family radical SAM protein [Treponema sp.]|uniref:SPL family radical SAM protein n=1 Tax=Treponema sp. TaxID=166 RepID=UPI003890C44D